MVAPELSRVVTFANGKGGAGKTTCAVNVAGLSAAAGWRTLLIDLDPQANAGHDLGYNWPDQDGRVGTDGGEHLVTALTSGQPLAPVLTNVRADLDVICGGGRLDDLEDIIAGRSRRTEDAKDLLAAALTPLAADYDLVVIDTPPTRPVLLQLALAATRWVVVPTKSDRGSIEGLRALAEQLIRVRNGNPDVEILGAILFDTGTSATRIRSNAADDIQNVLGGAGELFSSVIRHAEGVAVEARERGRLVHEIAASVADAEPWWVALKEGRKPQRLPGTAPALADDFLLLTQEILQRIARHEDKAQSA
ncbi:ParA family protein [Nocardioides lijunqiniae]|uniref:ParA family protein n=1 Tax=Nocardioides lijunqiniae TaxID=2760832 RepID=UPI001877CA73|nr:ParA family protein [Nocardioides lijunqiniae]